MQFAAAARAGLALDVDDRLDPRQMRRQRAAVGAALARGLRAHRRRLGLGLGRRLGFALLDLFQSQQQLIGRQRLGAAAEAVALQLLDDLDQPFGPDALGDQHRLQRFGIVGKRLGGQRHACEGTINSACLRGFCRYFAA